MRYFTADLHIAEKSIARWRGFENVAAHDAFVLGRLAETVGLDDELWILGDVARSTVEAVGRVRAALSCAHVHIVLGNHDVASKFVTVGGFDEVVTYGSVGKVSREGYKFCLSHYPMLDWDRAINGAYMLHGHIHSRPPLPAGTVADPDDFDATFRRGYNEQNRDAGIRRYDVGVDANDYRPVSADHILAFFEGTTGRYIYGA